ncbi:MAG: tetratricopeptide repeat protein [Deltaproteobacteria bacterium]|nr:tetratricopeptide repeat protein [Deltaproteobacteria bacterium]
MVRRKIIYLIILVGILLIGKAVDLSAQNLLDTGIREYKAENYEEALDGLTKAKSQQPDSSLIAFYLGLTYKQMGNYNEAVAQFKDALRLSPPKKEAYPELIETLFYLNEVKEAKNWMNQAEKERVEPGRLSFLKGLLLLKERNEKGALKAFKKAKELDPSLSQAADIQMARIYARQKRFSEAKESLKAVISVDPASESAAFAKEYEDALARSAKQYKPWSVVAGIAYQYDDNSLLKPSKRIPDVDISGEKDSSIVTSFRFIYTPLLKEPWIFTGQYASYTNTYFDNHQLNLINQSVSLTPGYNFNRGVIRLPVSFTYQWLREKEYLHLTQTRPTLHLMLSNDHFIQLSTGYARREMLRSPPNHDRNEERDGNIWSLSPGYLRPFKGGKGLFYCHYEFSSDDTEGKNWENIGNRFTLGLILPIVEKVSLSLSGDMLLQDYRHTHTFYGMERSDRIYYGSAGVRWEMLKGLKLNLQYGHTRADSNIDVYEYRRNVVQLGVEYTF